MRKLKILKVTSNDIWPKNLQEMYVCACMHVCIFVVIFKISYSQNQFMLFYRIRLLEKIITKHARISVFNQGIFKSVYYGI